VSKSLCDLEVTSLFVQHPIPFGKLTCEIGNLPAQQI
jgi:hypothetical protein